MSERRLNRPAREIDSLLDEVESGIEKYTSSIADKDMVTVPSFSDIEGKKLSELEGKTFSDILDMMFFASLYPTFVNPSVTISNSLYNNNALILVGSTLPIESTFSHVFNPGSIVITYPDGTKDTSQGARAGAETGTTYTYNNTSSFPPTLSYGAHTYNAITSYAEGKQPKDSKGNNYGTPLAAGSVRSSNFTIYASYYSYAGLGTLNTSTMSKGLIHPNATSLEHTFGAETANNRYTFWIPKVKGYTAIHYWDTNSSRWTEEDISNWNESSVVINNVNYWKITNNNPTMRGALKLRLTLTNA